MTANELNKLSERIIGIAIEIHKTLGPGFTEKIYEKALALKFDREKIKYLQQKVIKVKFENTLLGNQRIDFLAENEIILEIKTVNEINEIHKAQILSYLKTTNKKLGLILNFAKGTLEIKRVVNNF